jgi:hypothetical protein
LGAAKGESGSIPWLIGVVGHADDLSQCSW